MPSRSAGRPACALLCLGSLTPPGAPGGKNPRRLRNPNIETAWAPQYVSDQLRQVRAAAHDARLAGLRAAVEAAATRPAPPATAQHHPPLRSAEPDPATDTQRAELTLTPEHPPGEMSYWITDLTAAYRTFGERLADRQSMTIPAEDPTYGDLGRAFPLWPGPGRGAILQPPKRLGSTVGSSRAGVILIS